MNTRFTHRLTLQVFAVSLLASLAPLHAAEGEFRSLFNGKDLTGWDGNPELWSVEDGCITGTTTGPEQLAYNQFLIWRGGELKNFELRAKIKQSGNNSGIQYRSKELPEIGKWSVGGYQCDVHPVTLNNAMVYEERGRGIIVRNGQSMVVDPQGASWLAAQRDPVEADVSQWHEYTIIARGNHLIHKIDGQVTIDLVDHDEAKRSLSGIGIAQHATRRDDVQNVVQAVLLAEDVLVVGTAGWPYQFLEIGMVGIRQVIHRFCDDAPARQLVFWLLAVVGEELVAGRGDGPVVVVDVLLTDSSVVGPHPEGKSHEPGATVGHGAFGADHLAAQQCTRRRAGVERDERFMGVLSPLAAPLAFLLPAGGGAAIGARQGTGGRRCHGRGYARRSRRHNIG